MDIDEIQRELQNRLKALAEAQKQLKELQKDREALKQELQKPIWKRSKIVKNLLFAFAVMVLLFLATVIYILMSV